MNRSRPSSHEQGRRAFARAFVTHTLGIVAGATIALVAQQQPTAGAGTAESTSLESSAANAAAVRPLQSTAPRCAEQTHVSASRAKAAAMPEDEAEQDPSLHLKQTTRDLMTNLRRRIRTAELSLPGRDGWLVMSDVLPYLEGMADAMEQAAPEYAEELATEVETTLCDGKSSEGTQLIMLRLAGASPDFATSKAFDCIFAKRDASPALLSSAIEGWRASGLPKSEALQQLSLRDPDSARRAEGANLSMRAHNSDPRVDAQRMEERISRE